MDVNKITATDYLRTVDRLFGSPASIPEGNRFLTAISHSEPETRERLALELLSLARADIDSGSNPLDPIAWSVSFCESVRNGLRPEYVEQLGGIIRRMAAEVTLAEKQGDHTLVERYGICLDLGLIGLQKADRVLSESCFDELHRLAIECESKELMKALKDARKHFPPPE
jgi:hypothetical protein